MLSDFEYFISDDIFTLRCISPVTPGMLIIYSTSAEPSTIRGNDGVPRSLTSYTATQYFIDVGATLMFQTSLITEN